MKGLLLAIGPKKAPAESEEEEAGAEGSDAEDYKKLIADSAKAGDWSAFADAVEGLVKCCGEDD